MCVFFIIANGTDKDGSGEHSPRSQFRLDPISNRLEDLEQHRLDALPFLHHRTPPAGIGAIRQIEMTTRWPESERATEGGGRVPSVHGVLPFFFQSTQAFRTPCLFTCCVNAVGGRFRRNRARVPRKTQMRMRPIRRGSLTSAVTKLATYSVRSLSRRSAFPRVWMQSSSCAGPSAAAPRMTDTCAEQREKD